jgi:hypothetical protein
MTKEGARADTDLNLQSKYLERYGFDSMFCTMQRLLQYFFLVFSFGLTTDDVVGAQSSLAASDTERRFQS